VFFLYLIIFLVGKSNVCFFVLFWAFRQPGTGGVDSAAFSGTARESCRRAAFSGAPLRALNSFGQGYALIDCVGDSTIPQA